MNRRAWGMAALAGCLGCLGLLALVIVLTLVVRNPLSMGAGATPARAERSPSGRYWLEVVEGNCPECGRFRQFQLAAGTPHPEVVFQSPVHFRTRDRLVFTWDNEERVWVYSGDLGTFYWEQDPDGNWIKHASRPGGPVPPADLPGSDRVAH